ncbi:MAG TPA: DUF3054 domain-containing protein [Acidimicrobiales bacterium]
MRRIAVIVDFAFVLLFIVIGRSAHHHGLSLGGVVSTTWPFAVGLAVGWLVLVVTRRSGVSLSSGAAVVAVTVAVGMILRVIAGQGTAAAFILVALAFLGLMLLGWRILYTVISSRVSRERTRT